MRKHILIGRHRGKGIQQKHIHLALHNHTHTVRLGKGTPAHKKNYGGAMLHHSREIKPLRFKK